VNLTVSLGELNGLIRHIESLSRIVLDESKAYLVESRLTPLLKELDCRGYGELLERVKSDRTGKTGDLVIDRISTKETSFFRDSHPFDLLAHKLVPDFYERCGLDRKVPLRIWSAACSTGQETYSIAMTLRETMGDLTERSIRIVGTDISDTALACASRGCYTKLELSRGLSADRLFRHFIRNDDGWKISDELRSQIFFQKVNLFEPPEGLGRFDIIFCRNVAIYFSQENRKKLFDEMAGYLAPGGVLLVGSTESLAGVTKRFCKREFRGKIYYELF